MAKKTIRGRFSTGSTSAPLAVGASGEERLSPRVSRRRGAVVAVFAVAGAGFSAAASFAGCGGASKSQFSNSSSSGEDSLELPDGASVLKLPDGAVVQNSNPNSFGDAPVITCEAGTNAECLDNSACPNGGSTSIVGTVYDPADVNPVYNVTVYVPGVPESEFPDLSTLGVQGTISGGAPFCSCDGFYPPIVADAVTNAQGQFTITDAPYGNLTIVVQTGKWRMVYDNINITPCVENQIPAQTLRLPRNSTEGNLPDIAISTGGADSLECLPLRIGVDAAEYVGGSGTGGHIHIYQGFDGAATTTGTVASYAGLWNSDADLENHDVVLFSCEGEETHNMTEANQQSLVDYTNNGGRAFLSHYHYAWLRTGPFAADDLATWQGSDQDAEEVNPTNAANQPAFPAHIDTTFVEGQQMATWLATVSGLTPNPVATAASCPDCAADPGTLPIFYARDNVVTLGQTPQEWIHLDETATTPPTPTQYFSFDTPVGAATTAESQPCGRVVYSDLHVSGGPASALPPGCTGTPPTCYAADYPKAAGNGGFGGAGATTGGVVPNQCRGYGAAPNDPSRELSPQEKALEFMLFDLSSCLVPVNSVQSAPSTIPR